MATWHLIANPCAGSGRGLKAAHQAAAILTSAGQSVILQFTQAKGHGTKLAHQAIAAAADRVLVCGGDGTIAETLPALAGTQTALGILPLGTGNDFARALGLKPGNLRQAVDAQLKGTVSSLDLGYAAGRYFSTVATFGFDAEISQAMAQGQIPLSGTLGYIFGALSLLRTYRSPAVKLEGEFGCIEVEIFLAAGANTASYGGGLKIAPDADPTDGKLDVCILQQVSRWTIVSQLMPRLFIAKHANHPAVRMERSAWLRIQTDDTRVLYADGEYLATTPVTLEVKPKILRVVHPIS